MKYRRVSRPKRYIFRLVCIVLAAITAFLLLDARIRPMVRNVALVQAQNYAAGVAGTGIPKVLDEVGASYDSLVNIVRDDSGNIVSIQTDAMRMNMIKSRINSAVVSQLSSLSGKELGIPLGTLTGLALLNGRGPRLNVIISLTGSAETQFCNVFDSAGINQTRHQIFLKTVITLVVVFPTATITTAYTSTMLAAETIIVGKVPLAYGEVSQK